MGVLGVWYLLFLLLCLYLQFIFSLFLETVEPLRRNQEFISSCLTLPCFSLHPCRMDTFELCIKHHDCHLLLRVAVFPACTVLPGTSSVVLVLRSFALLQWPLALLAGRALRRPSWCCWDTWDVVCWSCASPESGQISPLTMVWELHGTQPGVWLVLQISTYLCAFHSPAAVAHLAKLCGVHLVFLPFGSFLWGKLFGKTRMRLYVIPCTH